jgi:hypothetical protein
MHFAICPSCGGRVDVDFQPAGGLVWCPICQMPFSPARASEPSRKTESEKNPDRRSGEAMARLDRAGMIMLLILAALGAGFFPFEKIYDDGIWLLEVTVRSAAGRPIKAVSGQAFGDPNEANYVLQNRIPPGKLYSATQQPFRGEKLAVPVPTSWNIRRSLLWEYHSFHQYNKLVVLVRYEAGKEEGCLIDIPDLRLTREITIDVP